MIETILAWWSIIGFWFFFSEIKLRGNLRVFISGPLIWMLVGLWLIGKYLNKSE